MADGPDFATTGALSRVPGEAVGSYPIQIGSLGPPLTFTYVPNVFIVAPRILVEKEKLVDLNDRDLLITFPKGDPIVVP